MSDLLIIPVQDGFSTQLAQDWNGATGTVHVLDTPSYTPTNTPTYIVVNPGKTNMQIATINAYDSTANTLTVSNITLLKGLGINSTAPASSHATGSKVIISDNYQFWANIQTAVNSKLDITGANAVEYATTAVRDSALGADGVPSTPYTNIYVTATGLFYNYNLSTAQWEAIDTGTTPGNATTSSVGLVRTDVAPAGIPVALIQDNPKYDALAGTSGVAPSATNKFMDERAMTGIVSPFAGSSAPTGWLLADGTAVSRTTYATLFAVISTTYGVGDGSTTFNVPNLKGKVPVGFNSSETEFDALGETGGSKNHTLTQAELPNVNFTVTGGTIGHAAGSGNGAGGGAAGTLTAITVSSGGSGTAHNNIQPYITLNYIIKT